MPSNPRIKATPGFQSPPVLTASDLYRCLAFPVIRNRVWEGVYSVGEDFEVEQSSGFFRSTRPFFVHWSSLGIFLLGWEKCLALEVNPVIATSETIEDLQQISASNGKEQKRYSYCLHLAYGASTMLPGLGDSSSNFFLGVNLGA